MYSQCYYCKYVSCEFDLVSGRYYIYNIFKLRYTSFAEAATARYAVRVLYTGGCADPGMKTPSISTQISKSMLNQATFSPNKQ